MAPDFDKEAIEFLSNKKNLILVRYTSSKEKTLISLKSTRNFLLVQEKDLSTISRKNIVIKTKKKVTKKQLEDMIFGFIVAKYVNSNAIVLSKNLTTTGIGVGQTNRLFCKTSNLSDEEKF